MLSTTSIATRAYTIIQKVRNIDNKGITNVLKTAKNILIGRMPVRKSYISLTYYLKTRKKYMLIIIMLFIAGPMFSINFWDNKYEWCKLDLRFLEDMFEQN